MTRYLNATQSLSLGEIGSLIYVSCFWIYGSIHVESSSKMVGHHAIANLSQTCWIHPSVSSQNKFSLLKIYFCISLNFFWGSACVAFSRLITFFLAGVEPNTLNSISCLSVLYVPCHFTMYGEKFISQWNYLNLWRLALCFPLSKIFSAKKVASCEKSRQVENRLNTGEMIE